MNAALKSLAIACLLAVCPIGVQAQSMAGPHRPASVPAGYLVTPFGYFHPTCVVQMAKGDELRPDDKTIRHADGSTADMHRCGYPHYRANGDSVFGDESAVSNPDISYAYVEYATVTTPQSYGYLYGQWSVPPAPASDDGQTLYLFPGLEDIKHVVTILQPVLGWNSDFGSAWGIASWNCCVAGTTYEALPQQVSSGDTILGIVANNCLPGTQTCRSWNVTTLDLRNHSMSQLTDTSNFGQTFNWAFGAALEVYGIDKCTDYPSNTKDPAGSFLSFNDLGLFSDKLVQIANPAWKVKLTAGLKPQCGYGVSQPKQIILRY